MQRRDGDGNNGYLKPQGICRRLFTFVVAKFMAGQIKQVTLGKDEVIKDDKSVKKKLIKKEPSRSDITVHFKQIEDSEDNENLTNKPERESIITLVNGSDGSKKRISDKGKSTASEATFKQPEAAGKSQPRRHRKQFLNDINEKSDAFIEHTLEKMRKSLN